jgi:hypothetical protein
LNQTKGGCYLSDFFLSRQYAKHVSTMFLSAATQPSIELIVVDIMTAAQVRRVRTRQAHAERHASRRTAKQLLWTAIRCGRVSHLPLPYPNDYHSL